MAVGIAGALWVAAPAGATAPGADGAIAVARDGDLWMIQPDGSGLTPLTSGPAPARAGRVFATVRLRVTVAKTGAPRVVRVP